MFTTITYLHQTDPQYVLLAPRKKLKISEGLRRQLAELVVTRCSPDFTRRKVPTKTARKYIPDHLTEWGTVQIMKGGDRIKGHALMNPTKPARRTCCFIRVSDLTSPSQLITYGVSQYESLVDKNASNNLPEDLVLKTSFAQLLRVVQLDLPPSRELYHSNPEILLLAHVTTCNATKNSNGQWGYSTMGKTHFIDLNLVQCSVGRVLDREWWTFVDRSGPTAHIEIASPATSSQSSITDISTSSGLSSNPSSSSMSSEMSEDSPLHQSPRC